jgi:hypothetical protein
MNCGQSISEDCEEAEFTIDTGEEGSIETNS